MSSIKKALRNAVEEVPFLSIVYRNIRDEYRFIRNKPVMTPMGFYFVGDRSMETGAFEPEETRIILEFFGTTDVFVDVGANIGFYTCLAKSAGKIAVAVEPCPSNLRSLYRNLEVNSYSETEIWPVGLAGKPGIKALWGSGTGASVIEGWANIARSWKQVIAVNTLDNCLGDRFQGNRLFIKVDVEGAEFGVLEGSTATLTRIPKPVWLMEITLCLNRPECNPNFFKTFEMFWRNGYDAYTADTNKRPVSESDVRRWMEMGSCDYGSYNWLFVSGRS